MVTIDIGFTFWQRLSILFGYPVRLNLHDCDSVTIKRKKDGIWVDGSYYHGRSS